MARRDRQAISGAHPVALEASPAHQRGLARYREEPKSLSRDAALTMFYEVEAVAGVEHVTGRGWYGVRRVASDVLEDVEKDERVQDTILANRKSVRQGRYQERGRKRILDRARETREIMRGRADSAKTTGDLGGEARSILEALRLPAKPRTLAALTKVLATRTHDQA